MAITQPTRPTLGPVVPPSAGGGTAMLLATLGLLFGMVPLMGPFAVFCGGSAAVVGVAGLRRMHGHAEARRAMALVGTQLGVVAVLMGVVGVVVTALG